MTTLTIRLLHTAPSNSDLTTLVNTADAEIFKIIVECSDRIAARSDPLERRQLQVSRLYLNSQIGHHMDPWWQKRSNDVYVMVDLVVTKT